MRAKPILSLTLLAARSACRAWHASPALGRMTLQSSLGQPLSAQIELTSRHARRPGLRLPRASRIRRCTARTVSPIRACSRAPACTVERLPNGGAVLKVTTSSSVVEPYLDLLVEVNWASGRVVRAYTFLLDPPGMPAAGSGRSRNASRAPVPRAARACADAAAARPQHRQVASGGAARRVRQQLQRPARRHAVADRRRMQTAERRRSNRCWSRSTTAIRTLSTAT